jgi:hypothetical protein
LHSTHIQIHSYKNKLSSKKKVKLREREVGLLSETAKFSQMPHKFIQGEKENTSKTITRKYAILESKKKNFFSKLFHSLWCLAQEL